MVFHVFFSFLTYFGSKYNRFFGSLKIGLNGLISFSSKPLYLMTTFGFFFSLVAFVLGIWYVVQKLAGFNIITNNELAE